MRKRKVTTTKACSKCGHGTHSKMQYDPMQDNLRVTCSRCGFAWRKEPLDKELKIEEE